MILAVDIGNSTIRLGVFDGALTVHKLDTYPLMPPSSYLEALRSAVGEKGMDKPPEGIVISSVVPGHIEALREAARGLSGAEPLLVGPELDTGLRFDVLSPEELGSDRIAASVAAAELYGPPVVAVDFGTATTVNFVGRGNVFKGGAILPGPGLMKQSLSAGTARLPEISLKRPPSAIGRDTEGCILSGVICGSAGAVERIITAAEDEEGERYGVVVTGGHLEFVLSFMSRVDGLEPELTLKGLKLIYERNR
jgi:type III pantothenate kinase